MSISTFIPTIWSARLLANLDNNLVAKNFMNSDYEGEISAYGDTVTINQMGAVTIKTYTKNGTISDPEELNLSDQNLSINKADYFNFKIDDVDKAQAKASLMDKAMQRSAYGLADVLDKGIFTELAKTTSALATPTITKDSDVYDLIIIPMGIMLDENSVPSEGRKIALPPSLYGRLLKDSRFISAGTVKTDTVLAKGYVGEAGGFQIFKTNNLPTSGSAATKKTTILAGCDIAGTYASQIVKTEAYKPEKSFADAVKGLNVYGYKLTDPKAMIKCEVATPTA